MATTLKDMLAAANAVVPRLTADELRAMAKAGEVLIVDVRDETEVRQSGKVKGALPVSRGMLEFRADPTAPSHNPAFQKDKKVVLYCGSGGRSALSGKTLKDLGYQHVYNAGGFKELVEAGIETEPA